MLFFVLSPFEGATPIKFGMPRSKVLEILGSPAATQKRRDYWGPKNEINIAYGEEETVNHLGFCPGEFELRIKDDLIWTVESHPDPNVRLLGYDRDPLEHLGFLIFANIGVTTAGYHDDDPNQYAITAFPKGAWDQFLSKATRPTLTKYH